MYSLKRLRRKSVSLSTISQHEALALGTTLQNTDLAISETKRGALPLASPLPVLVDEVDRAGKLRLCDAQTRSAQVGSAISVWQRAQNAVLNGRDMCRAHLVGNDVTERKRERTRRHDQKQREADDERVGGNPCSGGRPRMRLPAAAAPATRCWRVRRATARISAN